MLLPVDQFSAFLCVSQIVGQSWIEKICFEFSLLCQNMPCQVYVVCSKLCRHNSPLPTLQELKIRSNKQVHFQEFPGLARASLMYIQWVAKFRGCAVDNFVLLLCTSRVMCAQNSSILMHSWFSCTLQVSKYCMKCPSCAQDCAQIEVNFQ